MDLLKRKYNIKKLLKLKLRDKEIGKILGLSDRWIRACRKRTKLKAAYKVGRPCKEYKQLRDRKSTRLNSSHIPLSRMPSSA